MVTKLRPVITYALFQTSILIAAYFNFLSGNLEFYFGDITNFFQPICTFIGKSISTNHLPLWNSLTYCGMPQIAITSPNIFYPPNLLFSMMPFNNALAWNLILHQTICGIGGFLLIINFGWSAGAAAICALILALSGWMFSAHTNYTLVTTAAWTPICIWSLFRFQSNAKQLWRSVTLFTLSVTMLIAAGRPEISAPTLLFLLVCILKNVLKDKEHSRWRWQIKSLLIALALTAPITLPAIEWSALSRRSTGLLTGEVFLFSANWYDILCMFTPQPLGDLQLRYATQKCLVMAPSLVPYLASAFVGPVSAVLATIGFLDNSWQQRKVVFLVFSVSVLLALGSNTLLAPAIFAALPMVSLFRFPIKLLFFSICCLAIAAARGYEKATSDNFNLKVPLAILAIFILGALLLILFSPSFNVFSTHEKEASLSIQQSSQFSILCNFIESSLIAVLACLCLKRLPKRTGKLTAIVALLLSGLLSYAENFALKGTPEHQTSKTAHVLELLKKTNIASFEPSRERITSLYFENFSIPPNFSDNSPAKATVLEYLYSEQLLKPNTNILFNAPSAFGFEGSMVGDYYYLLLNLYLKSSQTTATVDGAPVTDWPLSTFLQTTATRFVTTQAVRFEKDNQWHPVKVLSDKYFHLLIEDLNFNLRVYEINDFLPRFYFTNSWSNLGSHTAVEHAIADPHRSMFAPQNCTLMEDPNISSSSSEQKADNTITLIEDKPESITLKVTSMKSGLLILADQNYPGWEATVDSRVSRIYAANAFNRAVAVDAGSHIVNFSYKPKSLLAGFIISVLGLIWLCSIWWHQRNARSKTSPNV